MGSWGDGVRGELCPKGVLFSKCAITKGYLGVIIVLVDIFKDCWITGTCTLKNKMHLINLKIKQFTNLVKITRHECKDFQLFLELNGIIIVLVSVY